MVVPAFVLALGLIAAQPGTGSQPAPAPAERTDVVSIEADDRAMIRARQRAQSELPTFFAHLARPEAGETSFSVKFDLDGSGEMIWADQLERSGDRLTGALANEPIHAGYRLGQRVPISDSAIVDWTYIKEGRVQGHHTTRVLLDHMPSDQAAQVRRALGW